VCRLTRGERKLVYKTLDRIATPGVLYPPGTQSRATALGWLCDRQQWQTATLLPESENPTKPARFWVYEIDWEMVADEMHLAGGNLAAIASTFLNNLEGVGEQESSSLGGR